MDSDWLLLQSQEILGYKQDIRGMVGNKLYSLSAKDIWN
jgi:hypothetical protein